MSTSFYELQPDGRMKFHIDNHRLRTFDTCPTLFQYTQVPTILPAEAEAGQTEGLVYRGKRRGAAMTIGGWWSRVMEFFYREMSFGTLPSVDQMLKFCADAWQDPELLVHLTELSQRKDPVSRFTPDDGMLMGSHYWWAMAETDFKSWKVIATESGFGLKDEVFIGESDEVVVYYTGKPDIVVYDLARGKLMVGDHKTVDYIKGNTIISFKPYPQAPGYVVAAKMIAKELGYDTEVTDTAVFNITSRKPPSDKPRDGVKKPRCIRAFPNYSPEELIEWQDGVIMKCEDIKRAILSGYFSRHENSCHIYGGCGFRGVCSVAPRSRSICLKADFNREPLWSPYEPEEEGQ